jgi:hypothetical protein
VVADWFGVRCVFHDTEGVFEERVTIWRAGDLEEAVELAEVEAEEYAEAVEAEYLGFAQVFGMAEPPAHGAVAFSLLRDSDLAPDDYLDHFFDTGDEREVTLDDGEESDDSDD